MAMVNIFHKMKAIKTIWNILTLLLCALVTGCSRHITDDFYIYKDDLGTSHIGCKVTDSGYKRFVWGDVTEYDQNEKMIWGSTKSGKQVQYFIIYLDPKKECMENQVETYTDKKRFMDDVAKLK